jgi:hypothetical protein
MQDIRDTLKSVLKKIEVAACASEKDEIAAVIKNILSKDEFYNIEIKSFSKGVLEISCNSSGWLYQINLKKQKIIDAAQEKIKGAKIDKIYLKLKNG